MRPNFDRTSDDGLKRYRFVLLPEPWDTTRPASLSDVIVDLGEFVGDGVPRDLSGARFEPLTWPKGLLKE